jgi:hypothetical protein
MIRVAHRAGASVRQLSEVSGVGRKTISAIVSSAQLFVHFGPAGSLRCGDRLPSPVETSQGRSYSTCVEHLRDPSSSSIPGQAWKWVDHRSPSVTRVCSNFRRAALAFPADSRLLTACGRGRVGIRQGFFISEALWGSAQAQGATTKWIGMFKPSQANGSMIKARTLPMQGLVNHLMLGVLRTPLACRLVGKRLVAVYPIGRKSGRRYAIPVAYTRFDGSLLVAAVVRCLELMSRDNRQFAKFNRIGFDRFGNPVPEDLHRAWVAGARIARLTPS